MPAATAPARVEPLPAGRCGAQALGVSSTKPPSSIRRRPAGSRADRRSARFPGARCGQRRRLRQPQPHHQHLDAALRRSDILGRVAAWPFAVDQVQPGFRRAVRRGSRISRRPASAGHGRRGRCRHSRRSANRSGCGATPRRAGRGWRSRRPAGRRRPARPASPRRGRRPARRPARRSRRARTAGVRSASPARSSADRPRGDRRRWSSACRSSLAPGGTVCPGRA